MKNILLFLGFSFFAMTTKAQEIVPFCSYHEANCSATDARRVYLGNRPICMMAAVCVRSGNCDHRGTQVQETLYCGMRNGDCPNEGSCLSDQSISQDDIANLTRRPTGGSGGGTSNDPCSARRGN